MRYCCSGLQLVEAQLSFLINCASAPQFLRSLRFSVMHDMGYSKSFAIEDSCSGMSNCWCMLV